MYIHAFTTYSFGYRLSFLRKKEGLSIRSFASKIGVSASYVNDVEKGKRAPFIAERMLHCKHVLKLTDEEFEELCEAAAAWKADKIAPDLVQYLNNTSSARTAIRHAMKKQISQEKWAAVIKLIDSD